MRFGENEIETNKPIKQQLEEKGTPLSLLIYAHCDPGASSHVFSVFDSLGHALKKIRK